MQNWETVQRQIAGLEAVERHIASEYTNHVPTIMATISQRPRYAFVSEQHGSAAMNAMNDRETVASYYAWSRQAQHDPIATRHPKQVVTDWYVFMEALPSRRLVGETELTLTHYALLFPFAEDGMVGEIMWKRTGFDETAEFVDRDMRISHPFPASDAKSLRLYERLAAAVAAADTDAIRECFEPTCDGALPDLDDALGALGVLHGREEIVGWFSDLAARGEITGTAPLNLVATSWYVFAEQAIQIRATDDASQTVICLAALFKVSDDQNAFEGMTGIVRTVTP